MKVHREDADYKEATTKQNCGNCSSMNPDGTCDKVFGLVDPQHVCRLYTSTKSIRSAKA